MSRTLDLPETYLNRARRAPYLSAQEEEELIGRVLFYQDSKACDRIIEAHMRLVVKVAAAMRGFGVPVDELVASGNVGLMFALSRFDPKYGARFGTYALYWVRVQMWDFARKNYSLIKASTSNGKRKVFFKLFRTLKELGLHMVALDQLERADIERIAKKLEVSVADVSHVLNLFSLPDASLDAPRKEDGTAWMDTLESPDPSPEQILAKTNERRYRRKKVEQAAQKLSDRDRDILVDRRLREKPVTLDDLSQKHGVSRERIRQIEEESIEKLRKAVLRAAREEPLAA